MSKKYVGIVSGIFVIIGVITIGLLVRQTTNGSNLTLAQAAGNLYTELFPPPLTGTILYVSNKTGNWDIYEMDLATKISINLTNSISDDMNPQVTPDGNTIAFYSNRMGGSGNGITPNNQIFLMDRKTRDITQLTTDDSGNYDPSYSPDGTKILFKSTRKDGYGDIYIMNSDGSEQINLTEERKLTEEWDPVFSSDGQTIYFISRLTTEHASDELFKMKSDGTEVTQLSFNTVPDWYPSINTKTNQIIFISKRGPSTSDDLFIADQNGGNRIDITNLVGNDNDPAWSLDGEKIIFINDHDGHYNMFIMNADGSQLQRIAELEGSELSPIFVPTPISPTP